MIGQASSSRKMKTVIVTGASKGIGAAIVRNLRVKGVRVIGVARSEDKLRQLSLEKIGSAPCEVVVGDVTDPNIAERAVMLATSGGQSLDGLILNAGTLGPVQKTSEMDIEGLRRSIDVNTVACAVWFRLTVPHLRASHGRIIYTSSGVATYPYAGFAAYCAGKAAGNLMIAVLAQEEPEIVAVAVAPGVVKTEMFSEFHERGASFMSPQAKAFAANLIQEGKVLEPEYVAESYAKAVLAAPRRISGKFIQYDDPSILGIML